jgi:hypothetical protein
VGKKRQSETVGSFEKRADTSSPVSVPHLSLSLYRRSVTVDCVTKWPYPFERFQSFHRFSTEREREGKERISHHVFSASLLFSLTFAVAIREHTAYDSRLTFSPSLPY